MPSERPYKIIYLELTNACNFTCDYCPIDEQTRQKVMMPVEFARDIIDQIVANELTDFLTFHVMGEPYLHKNLSELTGYAEARGLRVRLLTNGSLLDPERNEALFAADLTRLEVGFRTPNDQSFDVRLRGGALTLDDYVERVKGLLESKIRLQPRTEICIKFFVRSFGALFGLQDSYDHLTSREDNLRIATLLRDFVLDRARAHGHDTKRWESVPVRVVNGENFIFPEISMAFNRIQDFWVREQRGQKSSGGYPAIIGGCSAAFRDDFGILANGDVTTCCVDYDGSNVIGSLREQSLLEILSSDEARRMENSFRRFQLPTEFCRACRGGPTLASSVFKQVSTVAIDIRDRVRPRKSYRELRQRLNERMP